MASSDLINELLKNAQAAELNGNIDEAALLYQSYYSQRPFNSQYFPNLTSSGYRKNPRLSIIVPCHNSAKYIEECIDSILTQSFTDYELIIVDDGSTDNSFALILEKALLDERIVIIRNLSPSGSAGLPRNKALKIARGELIGFVDSDDWVGPLYFESLVRTLDEHNADLAISKGFINHQGEQSNQRLYPDKWKIKSSNANLACTHMSSMIWDKIYKKSLLIDNNIVLGSYPAAVDVPFIFKAYYYCTKPVTANTIDYNYRRESENSVTVRFRKGSSCDFELKAYQEIFDWSDNCQLPDSFKNYMRIKCLASFIYTCKLVKVDYFSGYFDRCRDFLFKLGPHFMKTSLNSCGQKNLVKAYDCFVNNSKKDFAALERPQLLPYFIEIDQITSLPKTISTTPDFSDNNQRNIVFFPDWSRSNPYQSLFYSNLRKNQAISSFDILGLPPDHVNEATLSKLVSDFGFIHIHWIHPFISTDQSTDMFCNQIKAVKSRKNAAVVWTVHNTISHECVDRETELSRRRKVSRVCDRFIVHSDYAAKIIRTLYDVPANRICVIPHGKYNVDHSISHPLICDSLKNRNRMRLSILGNLRKYKNAEWAVDFLGNLNSSLEPAKRIELRLAGKCISEEQMNFFKRKADQHDFISLNLKRLSDDELMREFCESDFIFVPYSNLLTSGICLNALSHGRPFIAPCFPSLEEFGTINNSILYDSETDLKFTLFKMNDFFHRGLLGYVFDPKDIVSSSSSLEWETILSSLPSNPFA